MTGSPGIAWYVSAHGWGHASRQREVMREVMARCPGIRISLVTAVPEWFWAGVPVSRLDSRGAGPVPVEAAGRTDLGSTRAVLVDFLRNWRGALGLEVGHLRTVAADMVVSDIDALPFAAALEAGIPATGLANFTWDWIFGNLLDDADGACELLARLYSGGSYLRLPLGPSRHPFRSSADMPLLPGGVPADPDRARKLLGRESPVMVVTLRDQGILSGPLVPPRGWRVVTSLPDPVTGATLNIPPPELEGLGLRFADLVACSDAVLLTPGYGIISQVLAGGTRAVVVRRHGFPETPYLMESLAGRPGTVVRDASELAGQGLEDAAVLSLEGPAPAPVAAGGIQEAAARILETLEAGTSGRPSR